jgi:prephenate dehydrogenase
MKKPETIGIIGGTGRMGQWFKAFFEKKGYEVLVSGRHTVLTNQALAQKSDVVIVSVPISITVDIIKEVGPYVRKDALFMDFTSLKKTPVEAMLNSSQAEVIGAHPLFGPGVEGLEGQTIVLCPARGDKWLSWVKEVFKEAHLEITSPEEHDKIMAVIQALTHFMLLSFGLTLKELPFSPNILIRYATPTFRPLWERILNMASQNAEIYANMQFDNVFYKEEILPVFLKKIETLKQIVLKQDKKAFLEVFGKIT